MRLAFWKSEPDQIERLTVDEWASMFNFSGNLYNYAGLNQTLLNSKQEEIGSDFVGLAAGAYKSNGVVFACMLVRQLLFSEARFQFRQLRSGRPGDLFGNADLEPLEQPWPGATTGDLLTRAIQDADLAGNFFCVRRPGRIKRMRPDWVTIVLGSDSDEDVQAGDVDAEVLGYIYRPGGPGSGREAVVYQRDEVAHFAPIPDPTASFRGMSWLTPIIREIMADSSGRDRRLTFFEDPTPNMVVKMDPEVMGDAFDEFVSKFKLNHDASKTLFLGGGADATVVGANLEQMDFKVVTGAGETRIAAAAGVPPIIVGLSEGLASATYSNYGQARRRFADGTMRPLWRNMAGSLASIIEVPGGSELWYDDRDIPFLQEDVRDEADIQQVNAATMRTLIDAGFEPESVVDAVTSGDLNRLDHTGKVSVQLVDPNEPKPDPENSNGDAPPEAVRALVETLAQIPQKERL